MNKRLVVPLSLALVLGGGFFLYKLFSRPTRLVFTGFVEGEERIVRSKVTGRIEEAPLREGDRVERGALLARIDDREIEARLAQVNLDAQAVKGRLAEAEANLARVISDVEGGIVKAQARVTQMEASADWARLELERHQRLLEARVISKQLLDRAETNHRQALANLEAARAQLTVAKGNRRLIDAGKQNVEALRQQLASQMEVVRQAEIRRSDYAVKAPFDATVETKYLYEGELATPGSPLVGLLAPEDRYVRVYIPAPDLDRVVVGTPVKIELDASPGTSYPGRITFIANETQFTPKNIETRDDRITQVYEAKATILKGIEHFKPGGQGNVYVPLHGGRAERAPMAEAKQGEDGP